VHLFFCHKIPQIDHPASGRHLFVSVAVAVSVAVSVSVAVAVDCDRDRGRVHMEFRGQEGGFSFLWP